MRADQFQPGLSKQLGAVGDHNLHFLFAHVHKRLAHKKHHGVAKVAVARKLLVRLYWMLRTNTPYPEVVVRMQGSSSHSVAKKAKTERLSGRPASRKKGKQNKQPGKNQE